MKMFSDGKAGRIDVLLSCEDVKIAPDVVIWSAVGSCHSAAAAAASAAYKESTKMNRT